MDDGCGEDSRRWGTGKRRHMGRAVGTDHAGMGRGGLVDRVLEHMHEPQQHDEDSA